MKSNIYRVLSSRVAVMGTLCLSLIISTAYGNQGAQQDDDSSAQWEHAAVDYEWTAMAQQDAAEALLSESRQLRDAAYENSKEHMRNLLGAASRESKAAGLEASAASSFDRAAKCWKKVPRKKDKNGVYSNKSSQMGQSATQKATIAYKRAAEIYELSANAYAMAKKPLQQANLSKRAAAVRELLARRN